MTTVLAVVVILGVVLVVALHMARRRKQSHAGVRVLRPRPFNLPTDAKRAMGREAEFKKMSEKFKDPLWDDDEALKK